MASHPPPSRSTTSASAPAKKPITIQDRHSPSEILPASTTLSTAFPTDPVLRWVLSQPPGRKHTSLIDDITFRDYFFTAVVTAGRRGGGTITSIAQSTSSNPYDCVGILIPPGHDPDAPSNFIKLWRKVLWVGWHAGWSCSIRILLGYPNLLKKLKASTFTAKQRKEFDYFYVFFLGTLESARGQGLASAWMRRCQELARREGRPIWLESSTEHSRDLYVRLGWKIVAEEVVGRGEVDRDGMPKEGGEGARLWGMVWWPEGKEEDMEAEP